MNTHMYIDGQAVQGLAAAIDVINPANLEVIATVQSATAAQLDQCIDHSKRAFETWKNVSDQSIVAAFKAIAADVFLLQDELARLITLEQGKPLFLAQLEVTLSIEWINYITSLQIPVEHYAEAQAKKVSVYNRPLGVIASITPWNWPFMIAAWHLFPAIKAKNCIINKPSEYTPLSTIKLVEIMNHHLPAGVCNLVLGDGEIGAALSAHPDIAKVTFTGSTRTGQGILQAGIESLRGSVLELGGNDVGIVLEDADVENSAAKIFGSAFLNAGQTCTSLKRLYVHEAVYEQVVNKLSDLINTQVMGNGLEQAITFGPVQNKIQFEKVNAFIKDAISKGATLIQSPQPLPQVGYFIAPALVIDIDEDVALVAEEQFGPVLPIIKFNDIDAVIRKTNQSHYGLGGSVWSKNLDRAEKIAQKMETGTVWINSHSDLSPQAAFGGWKLSGFGFSFGVQGLLQYTQKQAIHISSA